LNRNLRLDAPYRAEALQALVTRFGSPLLVIDCDVIRRQYHVLAAALPGVDLHFALKPLPEKTVIRVLAREGSWFDLATNGEIDLVRDAGIAASRCVHTHPIKRDSDIRHALDYGVTTFVVDNPDEIVKFAPYRDRVRLLLRVAFSSREAVVDLSRKFGCEPTAALDLVALAAKSGICVTGFSFHVGSQVARPDMYVHAIETCGGFIAEAAGRGLGPLEMLDIGGGFAIDYLEPAPAIGEFCRPIRAALAGLPDGVRVIAEPGRFICGPAGIALSTVMGRSLRSGRWWYYLDDGIYGTFSGQLYDHSRFPVEPLRPHEGPRLPCVLSGPTCDSGDVIAEDLPMPELTIGELMIARQVGAYTSATATDFNFFARAHVLFVNVEATDA
jgi:ornithine decarboxylase